MPSSSPINISARYGSKKILRGPQKFSKQFRNLFSGFELQQLTQPRRVPKQVVRLEKVPDFRNEHFPGVPESFPAADADQRHRQRRQQRRRLNMST